MNRSILLFLAPFAAACGGRTLLDLDDAITRSDGGPGAEQLPLADPCPGTSDPPPTLECTGLYTNIVAKQVSGAVRSYAPAIPLWSDGAQKSRWIYLPPHTT